LPSMRGIDASNMGWTIETTLFGFVKAPPIAAEQMKDDTIFFVSPCHVPMKPLGPWLLTINPQKWTSCKSIWRAIATQKSRGGDNGHGLRADWASLKGGEEGT
jgi:hypothetical protein